MVLASKQTSPLIVFNEDGQKICLGKWYFQRRVDYHAISINKKIKIQVLESALVSRACYTIWSRRCRGSYMHTLPKARQSHLHMPPADPSTCTARSPVVSSMSAPPRARQPPLSLFPPHCHEIYVGKSVGEVEIRLEGRRQRDVPSTVALHVGSRVSPPLSADHRPPHSMIHKGRGRSQAYTPIDPQREGEEIIREITRGRDRDRERDASVSSSHPHRRGSRTRLLTSMPESEACPSPLCLHAEEGGVVERMCSHVERERETREGMARDGGIHLLLACVCRGRESSDFCYCLTVVARQRWGLHIYTQGHLEWATKCALGLLIEASIF